MANLRCFVSLFLALLILSARVSSRALNSRAESRNVNQIFEALHDHVASAAHQTTYKRPDRVSPGGPDPHHH
ncbi:hypothetical protein OIU76_029274 [Salix suchowensis]|nr:hypothetical protein IMY05_004G0038400 [Salix suchowensis]KAJ6364292.1 hypothetical protein OIU76_029274 [Salix suchowensis]KAJ6367830.1 hypothetical protein OIU78_000405 [Salix suchowensis]